MKLRGITTIKGANAFALEFIEIYNKKFSKKPMNEINTHRSLDGYDLERILCRNESRTLLSGCVFQYNNKFYKVQDLKDVKRMKGRKVTVIIDKNDRMRVFLKNKELKVEDIGQIESQPKTLNRKEILDWEPKGKHSPGAKHPWKKYGYQIKRERELREEITKYEEAWYNEKVESL